MNERLQRAPIGVLDVSPDATVNAVNAVASELIDTDPNPSGQPLTEVAPRSVDDSLLAAFEDETVNDDSFEEYYPELDRWLSISVVPTANTVTVYVQDVTSQRRRADALERLEAERDRTAIIDDVLADVLADLVDASSREEIAETICTGLGETSLYDFAWVGERAVGGDGFTIRASAGETGETFAAVREEFGETTTPEERAVETGQLQIVQSIADDGGVPEAVRLAGFRDGIQSVLAIPLVYGSTVYGVVGVYASGIDAFSERERMSFETLGEIAGFAVTATRNRALLLSDAVTEVTLELDGESPLAALSGELDVSVTLEGVVPRGDETLVCFVAVDGKPSAEPVTVARDLDGVREVRRIQEGPSTTLSVELCDSSPLLAASSNGGTVREATFDGRSGQLVVDLPQGGEIRRMTDAIGGDYDVEVVAKRERQRSVTTRRDLRKGLDERLTERQKTVLRTAYLADYFESPRGSTAEEVASSLDITGSTLLYHLRTGQRKLLDAFFGEPSASVD